MVHAAQQSRLSTSERSEFIERYYLLARNIARKIIREQRVRYNVDDAEGAAIDALFNAAAKFDPTLGFPGHALVSVAVTRRVCGFIKKEARRRITEVHAAYEPAAPEPEEEIATPEAIARLHDAVDALPIRERNFVTRKYTGEKQTAIARSAGISKERVRQIIERAEARIRNKLRSSPFHYPKGEIPCQPR